MAERGTRDELMKLGGDFVFTLLNVEPIHSVCVCIFFFFLGQRWPRSGTWNA